MSIGAVAANASTGTAKTFTYGQGYGNYQNHYNAEDKTSQNKNRFSMNTSANSAVDKDADMSNPTEQTEKTNQNRKVAEGECQTCKNRKYSDVSDDAGVSFQTPTKVAPEQAASAVMGHEQEHVVRNQAKAEREDKKIVSQSVTLHNAICPECGQPYVSGGTTRTVTKNDNSGEENKEAQASKNPQNDDPFGKAAVAGALLNDKGIGGSIDARA